MTKTRPYVVRQGDYLTRIAARIGCDEDEIWNHPKNARLAEQGRTPDVLAPGDVLHVPDKAARPSPVTIGGDNAYVGQVPQVPVELRFRDGGEPLRDRPYEVYVLETRIAQGRTDGEGRVRFEVPTTAREAEVLFPEGGPSCLVAVGHIDPVTERSGQVVRLRQLGFLAPADDGPRAVSDAALRGALRRFQQSEGLPAGGACDGATGEALVRAFGR